MSEETLGETFDIHGGGLDLIFPHHENEIAQSVCAHDGHPFARYWLHNGMLTVGGAKMAKSEGNFVTVRDVLAQAPGEVIRLALLGTHYRDPLDWTKDRLIEARQDLDRFYRALALPAIGPVDRNWVDREVAGVIDCLQDDLNAHLAIERLKAVARPLNRYSRSMADGTATEQEVLRIGGGLLGLLNSEPTAWFRDPVGDLRDLEERIAERERARRERRFTDADRIRGELAAEGIILEDRPDGTTDWRRA